MYILIFFYILIYLHLINHLMKYYVSLFYIFYIYLFKIILIYLYDKHIKANHYIHVKTYHKKVYHFHTLIFLITLKYILHVFKMFLYFYLIILKIHHLI